jgi:L,D-transpeptidase catalytic domain
MKKFRFKSLYVGFYVFFAFMFQLPTAFAGIHVVQTYEYKEPFLVNTIKIEQVPIISPIEKMYDSLKLNLCGLSENAFNYAIKGYEFLKAKGKIANQNVISIVDFSKPSSDKRLFVLDLKNFKVLFNTYVAHGQNSGQVMATTFSNTPESLQSSLGFYKTSSTYFGRNGFSLKLSGLENGINNRAEERAIVMHGAPYANEEVVESMGHIGRSWGCPAVPERLNKPIIEKIKNGSCLFIFSTDKKYLHDSKIINS